ncbi:hypothetical protein [Caldimonas sp. KR1-144]|uniref:hypothetical protein n=1 Tax=Caldimonas sp. KR1-144 TaxID=3400911 RepID=UPI003C113C7A
MASKPENTWISATHKLLPPLKELYREKMSNPYRGGTPDVFYSGFALDLWCEYKHVLKLPVRVNLVPDLSELQLDWLTKRRAEGRNVIVAVGVGSGRNAGGLFFPNPNSWREGLSPESCRAQLLSRAEFAARLIAHCNQGINLCSTP